MKMEAIVWCCVPILLILVVVSGDNANRRNGKGLNEEKKSVEMVSGVNGSDISAPRIVTVDFESSAGKKDEGKTEDNGANLLEKKIGFSERLAEMVVIKMEHMMNKFFSDSGWVNIISRTSQVVQNVENLFKNHSNVIRERNNNDIFLGILLSNVTKKLKKVLRREKIILDALGPTGDRITTYLQTMSHDLLFLKDVAKITLDCKFKNGGRHRRKNKG